MQKEAGCPKCGNKKYWKIPRGARRCSICRHEYRISVFPVRLKRSEWKSIIKWFILEQSISSISEETGISRYQVMRALLHIRRLMALQVPSWDASAEVWQAFADELQSIMIAHRNIGHNWNFTEQQTKCLNTYLQANRLLVECLNVAYVSDRPAIEDSLLLPPEA